MTLHKEETMLVHPVVAPGTGTRSWTVLGDDASPGGPGRCGRGPAGRDGGGGRLEWHGRGLCVGDDPDAFFPSHGDPGMRAREICAACPVRADCLKYATAADEFGIWGGLDQGERRLRAQVAANTRWSRPMAREDQADAARAAMHERLERQVDPFGELPPDERDRRVRSAARALSAKLNLAKASKRKRTARA
jgi:Transcription factor WhiB